MSKRRDFGPFHTVYPMPVFVVSAYDREGLPSSMIAAWGGISEHTELFISISPDHKTTECIVERGVFTVSMADAEHVSECDYLGIESGKNTPDKLARVGFTVTPGSCTGAPIINELPLALECTLKSYDAKTGYLFADIENVSADERVLGEDGKIVPELLRAITYDPVHVKYRELGGVVGSAFSDGERHR